MYPADYARTRGKQAAFIMARSGESVTYEELEARANRLAHFLRSRGLEPRDHFAMFLENHSRFMECCAAGHRTGLFYTCINSYLTAGEVAYILNNSEAKLLITSASRLTTALAAMKEAPQVEMCIVVDAEGDGVKTLNLDEATAAFPATEIPDERLGASMLYSSGTTGRPKGVLRNIPEGPRTPDTPLFTFLTGLWRFRPDMIYLSPAPLYHSAPLAGVTLTIGVGGTAIIMEDFDPEAFLGYVERYRPTHAQLVPTMFSRMLKLPASIRTRYDLSSVETAIHAAAPCPVQVKEAMIEWWGPRIVEYYGATEGLGFTFCDSKEWLAHKGTVGKVLFGELHVLDEDMNVCPAGTSGTLWFKSGSTFQYFNDPERTAQSRSADGTLCTVGDVGYVDADGYVFLTDRSTFMIISGGVNIYPQETENLLITHPKVADAAVFGVPNDDLGEEVKAVVQLMPGVAPSSETVAELLAFCALHLARHKIPRSVDFEAELPRLPTGKLYKKPLRERYWAGKTTRIV